MRQHLPHPGLGRASELGRRVRPGCRPTGSSLCSTGSRTGSSCSAPTGGAGTPTRRPRRCSPARATCCSAGRCGPSCPPRSASAFASPAIGRPPGASRRRLPDFAGPTERWLESRILPRGDDLVVVLRDITERRSAETEVGEYADRMAEAERIARFGVWRWEVSTGRVRWSEELHRIYDVAPGAFGGTVDAFVSYLHPDDRDRVWSHIEHALRTLEPFAFQERIIRASGDERVLLSQGRVISGPDGLATALVGVCHDVTDRVEAERARGHSERRLRAVIDNSPSIIGVKDLDGRYLMANAECARVLGLTPDQLDGRLCSDLFPEIAEQLRENDLQAAALQEAIYDETVLVRDGEPRTYATVTFPLPDAAGRPVETCTIGTDVTERKERESARLERVTWERRIRSALARGPHARVRAARRRPDHGRACGVRAARAPAGGRRGARAGGVPARGRALRPDPRHRRLDGRPGPAPGPRPLPRGQPLGDHDLRPGRAPRDRRAARRRAGGGGPDRLRGHRDRRRRAPRGRVRVRHRADRPGLRLRPRRLRHGLRLLHLPAASCRCAT